jgi:hypothetical protein
MSIGGAVTGGTTGSVLFIGAGPVLAQDNAKFNWNDSSGILLAGSELNLLVNSVSTPAAYCIYQPLASGGNNWFFGEAGNTSVSGGGNVGIGGATTYRNQALNALSSGSQNMAIGASALSKVTTASNNVAVGGTALQDTITGHDNIGIGQGAAYSVNGNQNVAVGGVALGGNAAGNNNVAIGYSALQNTTGGFNIGIGWSAGTNTSTGYNNTFIGNQSGLSASTSYYSTLIGTWSGFSGLNQAIAFSAGTGNTPPLTWGVVNYTGWVMQNGATAQSLYVYNTLDSLSAPTNWERAIFDWNVTSNVLTIGTQKAGTGVLRDVRIVGGLGGNPVNLLFGIYQPTASGGNNWFFGEAGNTSVSGGGNVGIGGSTTFRNQALNALSSGSDNLAIGSSALSNLTTGSSNVAIGSTAMKDTVSGHDNVGLGSGAAALITGNYNIAIGAQALAGGTGINNNVAIGYSALPGSNSDGNTATGSNAGGSLAAGAGGNVFIGNNAGSSVSTGSYCTLIGGWQGVSSLNQAIAFSTGTGSPPQLSYNILNSTGWVFHNLTSPQSLYVYNTLDSFLAFWRRPIGNARSSTGTLPATS